MTKMKRLPMETEEERQVRVEEHLGKLRMLVATIVVCHTHLEKQEKLLAEYYPELAQKTDATWGDVFDGLTTIGHKLTKYAEQAMEDK
jgi:hypothetical protein